MFCALMLGKISSRSNCSYALASTVFVQPRQLRAIIGRLSGSVRPPVGRFRIRLRTGAKARSTGSGVRLSHTHDLIPTIDVDDLASDGCRGVAGEKYACSA